MHAAHAAADRRLDRRGLRQHAVLEAARFLEPLEPGEVGVGDERARVVAALEDARRARAEDQLLRAQRGTDGGGDRVGVDIEHDAGIVRGHGLTTGIRPASSSLRITIVSIDTMSPT